ncbi:Uncharacterised protein [Catenibacterium mitsuokai]|nr:Uncharacterised protein [Catenibacterium mitsuokai]
MCAITKDSSGINKTIINAVPDDMIKDLVKDFTILVSSLIVLRPCRIVWNIFINADT